MRINLVCNLVLACTVCVLWPPLPGVLARESDQPTGGVQFSQLGTPLVTRQYVSEKWGIVGVNLLNPGREPAEVLTTFAFSEDADVSFARRIRIPPQSIRRAWVPIKLPRISRKTGLANMFGLLIDRSSGSEVAKRHSYDRLQQEIPLRVNHDIPISGVFLDDVRVPFSQSAEWAYEALIALRTGRGYERRMVMLGDRHLPPIPESLDVLDQLVLYNNRFARDATVMATIRSWVNQGGELWVMLDQVQFDGVEQLLGNVFSCALVDRVQISDVDIQVVDPRPDMQYTPMRHFEQPVNLARVVTSGMEVTHTIDGWPAAFRCSVGRGNVIFTTVGARAWSERFRGRREVWDPKRMTDYAPTPELEELAVLLPPPAQRPFSPKVFEPYLNEQIGYRVVSRAPVLTILGLFCASLFAAGVFFARSNHLERMAWFLPAATLLTVVPLVWIGARAQHRVPPTVGEMQYIQASEEDGSICASGLLAMYSPTPSAGPLGAEDGGIFYLDETGLKGMKRRMVWTDLGQWHWENLKLPAGVRTAAFERSTTLDQPLEATATFDKDGLDIELTGSPATLSDALVAAPAQPRLAVHAEGKRFHAGPGDVLAAGQFVATTLLSDEQRRRERVYEQLLDVDPPGPIGRLTLMGWTKPLDMRFVFPEGVERIGAALWAIPLQLRRPPAGTDVVIPSPLVTYRVVKGPVGHGTSSLYDARTGQWVQGMLASKTWLRFQIPTVVLPIDVRKVRLSMKITAPNRIVQVLREVGDKTESLASYRNPIGRIDVDIQPPSIPKLDARGGLRLGVSVDLDSEDTTSEKKVGWKIDWLQLEVAGRSR